MFRILFLQFKQINCNFLILYICLLINNIVSISINFLFICVVPLKKLPFPRCTLNTKSLRNTDLVNQTSQQLNLLDRIILT